MTPVTPGTVTATPASWRARPGGADYDAVRARLVEATVEVIAADGLAGLRQEAVAARAGLARSSVYRYFGSKRELVMAAVVDATLRIGRRVIDRIGPDAEPERFLVEGIGAAIAEMAADPVLRSLAGPSGSPSMTRLGNEALREGVRPLVQPLFDAAAARGVLRPGVDADDAVRWLQVVALGLMAAPAVVADEADLSELLERMLVPALLRRPGRGGPGPG